MGDDMRHDIISKLLAIPGLPVIFSTDQAVGLYAYHYGPRMVPTHKQISQKLTRDRRIILVRRDTKLGIVLWSKRL